MFHCLTALILAAFCVGGLSAQEMGCIMSANLTSGHHSSYDPGHGARMMKALKPVNVLFQEFKIENSSNGQITVWVDATFGKGFYWFREQVDSGGDMPNGIISRYPILDHGEWEDPHMPN